MQFKQRQKIISVVTLLAFLSLFLPTYFAHASILDWTLPSITDLATYGLQVVFGIIGNLTAIFAKALNTAVFVHPGGNILIVATTWKILRDFANMFFIIMLIYMAFATIFNQGKYTFKDMIVRFLIVAILINFSLVIGNLVIDASQVLSNIFLGSIGNVGDRLGSYLNPSLLLPKGEVTGASLISLVFAIILSLIFLFNILVALVFSIVRVPIIWALLIVSPLAWMSYILPSSGGWWKKWWSQFMGWNLFLPVYLFFMYLGLLFLSKQQEIMKAVIQANATANPANDPLLATLSNSLSFNMIFFYLFSAFVMLGGIWAATKTTSLFSEGFEKGVGWAKWAVKNFPTPVVGSLTNWQEATKMRKDQFIREGAFGYLGTEKSERKTAEIAGRKLLFGGVRDAKDKQLGSDVSTWKGRYNNLDTNQLRQQMNSGQIHQQLATRELLKDRGQLSTREMENTYDLYNKTSPASAIKFGNSIEYGKLSSEERKDWYRDTTNIELKKKIAGVMADKGDFDTPEQIRAATNLFTLAPDKAEFLKKAARRITDNKVLTAMMNSGTRDEKIAVREILMDRKELDPAELWNTYAMFPEGSKEAQEFGKKIDFKNLDKDARRDWYSKVKDVEVNRKVAEAMADKGDFKFDDTTNVNELYDVAKNLYKLDGEKEKFLKDAQKKNFIGAVKARAYLKLAKKDGRILGFPEALKEQVKDMKEKDLAELNAKTWGNKEFRDAVIAKLEGLQTARERKPKNDGKGFHPGGGDAARKRILDAIGADEEKLNYFREIKIEDDKKNQEVDESEIPPLGPETLEDKEKEEKVEREKPKDDNKPKRPGTVSYHGTVIPHANVIDLRNPNKTDLE